MALCEISIPTSAISLFLKEKGWGSTFVRSEVIAKALNIYELHNKFEIESNNQSKLFIPTSFRLHWSTLPLGKYLTLHFTRSQQPKLTDGFFSFSFFLHTGCFSLLSPSKFTTEPTI